jgi:hypothetical protein
MLSVNYGVSTGAISPKKQEDSRQSWASTVLNGVREVGRWAVNHPGLVFAFVSVAMPTLARAEDVVDQQLGVCPVEPVTNSE